MSANVSDDERSPKENTPLIQDEGAAQPSAANSKSSKSGSSRKSPRPKADKADKADKAETAPAAAAGGEVANIAPPEGAVRSVDATAIAMYGRGHPTAATAPFEDCEMQVYRPSQLRDVVPAGDEGHWRAGVGAVEPRAWVDHSNALRVRQRYSVPPLQPELQAPDAPGECADVDLKAIDQRDAVKSAKGVTEYPQHVERHATLYEARGGEFEERSTLVVHDHLVEAAARLERDVMSEPKVKPNHYNPTAALAAWDSFLQQQRADAFARHGVAKEKEKGLFSLSLPSLPGFGPAKPKRPTEGEALGTVKFDAKSDDPDSIAHLYERIDHALQMRTELGLTEEHVHGSAVFDASVRDYVFDGLRCSARTKQPFASAVEFDHVEFRRLVLESGIDHPELATRHFSSRRRLAQGLTSAVTSDAACCSEYGTRASEAMPARSDEFFVALARMRQEPVAVQELLDRGLDLSPEAERTAMAADTFGPESAQFARFQRGDEKYREIFDPHLVAVRAAKHEALASFFAAGNAMGTLRVGTGFNGKTFLVRHPFKAGPDGPAGHVVGLDLTVGHFTASVDSLKCVFLALLEGRPALQNLRHLILDGNQLLTDDILRLVDLLGKTTGLRTLSLAGCRMPPDFDTTHEKLAKAIASGLPNLEAADFSDMHAGEETHVADATVARFVKAVTGKATLKELWVAGALPRQLLIDTAPGSTVASAPWSEKYAEVSRMPLGTAATAAIVKAVRELPALTSINFSFVTMSPEAVAAIAAAVFAADRFHAAWLFGIRLEIVAEKLPQPETNKAPPLCCLTQAEPDKDTIVVDAPSAQLVDDVFNFAAAKHRRVGEPGRVAIVQAMLERYSVARRETTKQHSAYVLEQSDRYDRLRRYAEELRFRKELELAQSGAGVTGLSVAAGAPPARPTRALIEEREAAERNKGLFSGFNKGSAEDKTVRTGERANAASGFYRCFRCLPEPLKCGCCK